MLAITIVLFVVPHNQQIVTIRQFFTCRIPLFRNQNLNIKKNCICSLNFIIGGAYRDRTDDPLRARQVLSQLSYGPNF